METPISTVTNEERLDVESVIVGVAIASDTAGEIFGLVDDTDFKINGYRDIISRLRKIWQEKGKVGKEHICLLPKELQEPAQYAAATVPCLHAESYCERLKILNATEAGQSVAYKLMYAGSLEELRECAEVLTQAIRGATPERDTVSLKDLLPMFVKEHNRPRSYIRTGFSVLDKYTHIERGDYIVLGARPSEGKTALALNLAANMAKAGLKVGFFSLETAPQKLTDRLIAAECSIDYGNLKRSQLQVDEWQTALNEIKRLEKLQLWMIPASGKSASWIRAESSRLGLDVAFIDYLSLIRSKGKDIYERTTTTSVELHEFAQQTKTVVVALSQLNRGSANAPKEPTLERLRETGQIEQDADVVILLHNPITDSAVRQCKLIIAKNKEGICGSVKMTFRGQYQQFSETTELWK